MRLDLFAFYISILAVSLLCVMLLMQWYGQLTGKRLEIRIAPPWRLPFSRIDLRTADWPDGVKLLGGIVLAVLFSRLMIIFIGSIWSLYFTDAHTLHFGIWLKWDGFSYLHIAENGYMPPSHEKAVLLAFYPLYPLLIKVFWFLFRDYYVSAYFVSLSALVAACIYLFKLVNAQYDSSTAKKAVLFLLVSPFSVFLGLVFSESLFLAFVLGFFYYLEKRCWLAAGLAGCLAALTKNQGVLLLLPYLVEAIPELVHRSGNGRILLQVFRHFASVSLILTGFLIYLLVNYNVTGDPFKFLEYQQTHWHNSFGFFAQNIQGLLRRALNYKGYGFRFSLMVLQPVIFFASLATLIVAVLKKMSTSITAFSLVFLLVSFSPTWLLSAARYSTALFIIPMLLAKLSTTTGRLVVFSGLSVFFMNYFVIVYMEGVLF